MRKSNPNNSPSVLLHLELLQVDKNIFFNPIIRKLLTEVINDLGGDVLPSTTIHSATLQFPDFSVFEKFRKFFSHILLLEGMPAETRPFVLYVSLEVEGHDDLERKLLERGLLDIRKIGLQSDILEQSRLIEVRFPSEESYFTLLINFIQNVFDAHREMHTPNGIPEEQPS